MPCKVWLLLLQSLPVPESLEEEFRLDSRDELTTEE
jgi:hypothetical protein